MEVNIKDIQYCYGVVTKEKDGNVYQYETLHFSTFQKWEQEDKKYLIEKYIRLFVINDDFKEETIKRITIWKKKS